MPEPNQFEYMRPCRACGEPLAFLRMPSGKLLPLNLRTGQTHFVDCPKSDLWRKPKKPEPASAPEPSAEQPSLLDDASPTTRGYYDD